MALAILAILAILAVDANARPKRSFWCGFARLCACEQPGTSARLRF